MIFTVENDLSICEQLKITPAQLGYIKLFILDPAHDLQTHLGKVYERVYRYTRLYNVDLTKMYTKKSIYAENKELFINNIIKPLIEKNIILNIEITKHTDLDMFEINPEFLHLFTISLTDMPTELHTAYPHKMIKDGKLFPLKNQSPEEFGVTYLKLIQNDRALHDKIIAHIEWAKENNFIYCSLKKFIENSGWNLLFELKEGGGDGVGFSVELG